MSVIYGNNSNNTLNGSSGKDTIYGYAGNDSINGNGGNDIVYGGDGNDTIVGGAGADSMSGSTGNDTYYVDNTGDRIYDYANEGTDLVYSSVSYSLSSYTNTENLYLTGSQNLTGYGNSLANVITGNTGKNVLYGYAGDDTISGGNGNDTIDGGSGIDVLNGGSGNDVYYVDNILDRVIESSNSGTDYAYSSVSYTLAPNVEYLVLTGSSNIDGTGNELGNSITGNSGSNILSGGTGNDTLSGGAGNDVLIGGVGNDSMVGGAGNDTYYVDSVNDKVVENSNQGTDTVISTLTYTLGNNLENLTFDGSSNMNGTGNNLSNIITGNTGNNILNGLGGNDILAGGLGNDTYTIGSSSGIDLIRESQGEDKIIFDRSDAKINSLTFTKSNNDLIIGIKNSANTATIENWFVGNDYQIEQIQLKNGTVLTNSYINDLFIDKVPLVGDDNDNTLEGNALSNTISGNGGNDTIYGYEGNDTITGGTGNDSLIGGAGADSLDGGDGNDSYTIDSQDILVEIPGGGTDTVNTDFSYTLLDNFENLNLTGTANINGTGNSLDNIILGNSGNNTLTGNEGNDTLAGGAGNDILIGGPGIDSLDGGADNDTYIIDSQDLIFEDQDQGTDTINTDFSYILPENFENLVLLGSSDINGEGNQLNNIITGNSGNNELSGKEGGDTIYGLDGDDTLDGGTGINSLVGGAGNDVYYIDNSSDQVSENINSGNDIVYSNVTYNLSANIENLVLTGADDINATGNDLNNSITGNSGNNELTGGAGTDSLSGGDGNDTYIIDSQDIIYETVSGGIDTVKIGSAYTLLDNFENLLLLGTSSINGSGNDVNNLITGNSGNNELDGYSGDDTLIGGAGNDTLVGGSGSDSLVGEGGNDVYYVDTPLDQVIESSNGGTDTVYSSTSFSLDANIENIVLTGSSNNNATGNSLNNIITGNTGDNILDGGSGNDTYNIITTWGSDTIQDSSGNDQIVFYQGISKNSLGFDKSGDDLIINHNNTDFITVKDWYSNGENQVEKLVFYDGSTLTSDDIDKLVTGAKYIPGTENNDVLTGTIGNDTIDGKAGDDLINGGDGKDVVYGGNGNDTIYGGASTDTLYGGLGDDVYYVTESNDKIVEDSYQSPDTSYIDSPYLQDIYSRVFPRLMGNQWSFTEEGVLLKSARYMTVDENTVVDWDATNAANDFYLNIIAKYFDYIVMNRAGALVGTDGYSDLYCDNYDSLFNLDAGLSKAMSLLKAAAASDGSVLYTLAYLNMTDVWNYESVNNGYDWNFWQSQEYFDGQNFGTWDYCKANNLFLKVNGKLIDYYGSSDTQRPFFDATNPLWQEYATLHLKGILDAGFDGIFSDNWLRSQTVGNLSLLSASTFKALQDGWNTIGANIQALMDNPFLIGNSPADAEFTSRDVCMLEDRIDDALGTLDRSIASYFRYTYIAEQLHQVCQDTYYAEAYGPYETFRIPMCLLTDNIFGLGSTTDHGTSIENLIKPFEILGDIGIPEGDKFIVSGTDTGIADVFYDGFSFERAVYERIYSNGLVYLNDTASKVTITLPYGEWIRSDGSIFDGGSQLVLDSLRGWVFKRTDIPVLDHSDNGGFDTVYSTVSYTLPDNVEKLVLTGSDNIQASGNALDNILIGNYGNNDLIGLSGNDTYDGYIINNSWGDDTITDISGNDTLNLNTFSLSDLSSNNITFSAVNVEGNTDNVDALLIKFINGETIQINNYFDDTSPVASTSGQGIGVIENIVLNDGILDFSYIQSHIFNL